jgi:DNA-binding SARP family transcriptional activator
MEVQLLGPLVVVSAGPRQLGPEALGGRKPKQLLELLALARGRPVPKDRLVELLWRDRPPRDPIAALENHVWVLRRHLRDELADGRAVVVGEAGAYRLAAEHVRVDLDRFDALVSIARRSSGQQRRRALDEACSLDRGEVLADEPYADWAQATRETYAARVTSAHLDLAEAVLAEGEASAALGPAMTALQREPLSDRACRLVMRSFAELGDRARALRSFESFKHALTAELGVEPDGATLALARSLRTGGTSRNGGTEPARAPRDARPAAGASPALSCETEPTTCLPDDGLVGRSAEIRRLTEAIGSAVEGGGGLVLVEGLAHVGTTAVVATSLDRLPQLRQARTTFPAPLTGLTDVLVLAAVCAAVDAGPDGRVTEPAGGRLAAASDLLRRNAPIVLVLEDLHLGERDEIVRAIVYLQAGVAGAPIAMVGVFRSEEVAYHHPLRSLRVHDHLVVDPLPAAALAPVGGATAAARTGGHGAYLPAWTAGGEGGAPSRELAGAILGRCQAAGPRAYRLLLAASVLPEPVTLDALARATSVRLGRVAEDVDALAARGLLQDRGSGGLGFTATLVRDVLASQTSALRREVVLAAHGSR